MKTIYISHPLRGPGPLDVMAVVRNKQCIDEICMGIKIKHPDVLIYSPLHNLSWESALGDQSYAIGQCLGWVEVCDELWVYGDWRNSEGCAAEVELATSLGKVVIDRSDEG